MADDLRERIQRGELAALADPALPLHLLAEPDADWWLEGRIVCTEAVLEKLQQAATQAEWQIAMRQGDGGSEDTNLSFARRLRALLPGAPPEVDAALAVLARYAR